MNHREIHVVPSHLLERAGAIKDRVNELVEPLLADGVHGYRKGHSTHTAVAHIERLPGDRLAFDIVKCFNSIDKKRMKAQLDRLDPTLWRDIDPFLGAKGLRTGPCFVPMLANLYLSDLDHRFGWVRYADNIMIVGDDPERTFLKAQRHLADIGLTCHDIEANPRSFLQQPLKEVIHSSQTVVGLEVRHLGVESRGVTIVARHCAGTHCYRTPYLTVSPTHRASLDRPGGAEPTIASTQR